MDRYYGPNPVVFTGNRKLTKEDMEYYKELKKHMQAAFGQPLNQTSKKSPAKILIEEMNM